MVHGSIFLLYWAMRGVDVDAFYRFQDLIFGNAVDFKTIAAKVLIDQFCIVSSGHHRSLLSFTHGKKQTFPLLSGKGKRLGRNFLT